MPNSYDHLSDYLRRSVIGNCHAELALFRPLGSNDLKITVVIRDRWRVGMRAHKGWGAYGFGFVPHTVVVQGIEAHLKRACLRIAKQAFDNTLGYLKSRRKYGTAPRLPLKRAGV